MSSLKPCSFCGAEPTVSYYHIQSPFSSNEVQFTKVGCDECDVAFNSEPDFETDAITAWNTRAPIPVTDEMVERAMVAVAIEMGHTAESFAEKRKSDFEGTAKNRRAMRAALTAALGGGNGNV